MLFRGAEIELAGQIRPNVEPWAKLRAPLNPEIVSFGG